MREWQGKSNFKNKFAKQRSKESSCLKGTHFCGNVSTAAVNIFSQLFLDEEQNNFQSSWMWCGRSITSESLCTYNLSFVDCHLWSDCFLQAILKPAKHVAPDMKVGWLYTRQALISPWVSNSLQLSEERKEKPPCCFIVRPCKEFQIFQSRCPFKEHWQTCLSQAWKVLGKVAFQSFSDIDWMDLCTIVLGSQHSSYCWWWRKKTFIGNSTWVCFLPFRKWLQ